MARSGRSGCFSPISYRVLTYLDLSTSSSSNGSPPAASSSAAPTVPSPFPDLGVPLSAADLRKAAYKVLVAASRTTGERPLTYIPQVSAVGHASPGSASSAASANTSSPSLQHSLTSATTSKMKKVLGLRSSASSKGGSPGSGGGGAKAGGPAAAGNRRGADAGADSCVGTVGSQALTSWLEPHHEPN